MKNIDQAKKPSGKLTKNVIALGLVSLFNDASSEIIYPLLPVFLTGVLGVSVQFVGLIEGITESASSLLKYPAGWITDRVGKRKWMVVIGYGIASAIRPFLAMATAGWQVLSLRFLDRFGKGLRSAPRDALIADSVSSDARGLAFGFHRAMDHLGAIIGSLTAAWLVVYFAGDIRKVFWIAALPAFIGFVILIIAVKEKKTAESTSANPNPGPEAARTADPASIEVKPFDQNFKAYLAVLLLFTLGNSSDAFLLLKARDSGVSIAAIPILWAALHLSKTVSSLIGGSLSDRFGRKRLIIAGWIVYAAIYAGFAFSSTKVEIWALFIIYGIYFGLTEGVEKAFVADLVPASVRGSAYGLYNLIIGIGALPASLLMGFLWQRFNAATALMTGASFSVLAVALLVSSVSERQKTSSL